MLLKKSIALLTALFTLSLAAQAAGPSSGDPDPDFDRLDGTGKSGKRVDVIEWEGNLEIHVYPYGSLKGLSLKLDKRNKAKPVMVIGYRFKDSPKEQLIRRAILGIDLQEGFKAFREAGEHEFDKIIISNNGLSSGVVAYSLEPEPTQLYPDGHPALAQKNDKAAEERRQPASQGREDRKGPSLDEDTGTIQPFYMKSEGMMNRR